MRAQTTQVSVMLLFVVTLTLIIIVYTWGSPMLERGKEATSYEYAISKLSETRHAISSVSMTEGSQYTVNMNLENIQLFVFEGDYIDQTNESANNSIDLRLAARSDINDSWVLIDPEENDMDHIGELGSDNSGVIIGKSNGETINLRLWYRKLYDNHTNTTYEIQLIPETTSSAHGRSYKLLLTNNGTFVSGNNVTTRIIVGLV